ncbi:MAG: hypothetical protein ABI596_12800 [Pyrinomonadaceae bacterium]
MSELEEHWANALAEAERRARTLGRKDLAEYVALRSANDLVRRTAVEWLISTVTALATEVNGAAANLEIEHQDNHRFRIGQATMVGQLLTVRRGIPLIQVEAGWPRTPPDGFVRGGGLARAHIKHLGKPNVNEELLLTQSRNKAPQWKVLKKSGEQIVLTEAHLRNHLSELLKN